MIPDLSAWALYLDLDGVFADYDAGIRRLGFTEIDPAYKNTLNRSGTGNPMKRQMHDAIKGTEFYRALPLLPGAAKLYAYVQHANPIILTAAPKFGATEDDYFLNPHWLGAAYHKRWWVEHHLLPEALPYEGRGHGRMLVTRHHDRIAIEDERFICTTSARKQEFIRRKHSNLQVLIDDRRDNCVRWARAGGIAILHTSVQDTIDSINILQFGDQSEIAERYTREPRYGGLVAGLQDVRTWAEMEPA